MEPGVQRPLNRTRFHLCSWSPFRESGDKLHISSRENCLKKSENDILGTEGRGPRVKRARLQKRGDTGEPGGRVGQRGDVAGLTPTPTPTGLLSKSLLRSAPLFCREPPLRSMDHRDRTATSEPADTSSDLTLAMPPGDVPGWSSSWLSLSPASAHQLEESPSCC